MDDSTRPEWQFCCLCGKFLEVYKHPYDPRFPVVCMDESPKQLIGETKTRIDSAPRRIAKSDYEYKRHGVCNTAWQNYRNNKKSIVNWQFTADNARIKSARLYPSINA